MSWRGLAIAVVVWAPTGAAQAATSHQNLAATKMALAAELAFAETIQKDIPEARTDALNFVSGALARCPRGLRAAPHRGAFTDMAGEARLGLIVAFSLPIDRAEAVLGSALRNLRWTSRETTKRVTERASEAYADSRLPPPHLCGDLRAWEAKRYKGEPRGTKEFLARYLRIHGGPEVSNEEVVRGLKRYETPSLRRTAETIEDLERRNAHLLRDAIIAPMARLEEGWGLEPAEEAPSR